MAGAWGFGLLKKTNNTSAPKSFHSFFVRQRTKRGQSRELVFWYLLTVSWQLACEFQLRHGNQLPRDDAVSWGERTKQSWELRTCAREFRAWGMTCVWVCQRKTKDRADGMREKVPIPLDGIRTCTSGIRAHRASDYTTRIRPPRVSWNKHFRHSPVSSTAKQSCMKHCVCMCVRALVWRKERERERERERKKDGEGEERQTDKPSKKKVKDSEKRETKKKLWKYISGCSN